MLWGRACTKVCCLYVFRRRYNRDGSRVADTVNVLRVDRASSVLVVRPSHAYAELVAFCDHLSSSVAVNRYTSMVPQQVSSQRALIGSNFKPKVALVPLASSNFNNKVAANVVLERGAIWLERKIAVMNS